MEEIRSGFRRPLGADETVEKRLQEAESRLGFLRMTMPKARTAKRGGGAEAAAGGGEATSGREVWVYKDGKRLKAEGGTLRDAKGRVVSNFDGNNLDPESVTRHKQQLKRMGFTSNAHAKGVF